MKLSDVSRCAVVISKKGNKTEVKMKPSRDAAIKGAGTGALIGSRFGPMGIATGTLVGGVLGYVLG